MVLEAPSALCVEETGVLPEQRPLQLAPCGSYKQPQWCAMSVTQDAFELHCWEIGGSRSCMEIPYKSLH